ncbi:hypothetical protein LINGRAHAP2_LOCUS24542, partial [Linum grandiflorum]
LHLQSKNRAVDIRLSSCCRYFQLLRSASFTSVSMIVFLISNRITDTVDDFAFQPSQPITVSSSGHRRFQVPADEDNSYQRTGTSSYAYHLQNFFKLWLSSCGTSHLLNYDYLKLCFTPTNDANNQVMVAHWTNKAIQKGVEELELNFDRGLDLLRYWY